MDYDRSKIARMRYFDTCVYIEKMKDCISGKNEKPVLTAIENLGYKLNEDFVRQHPIGCKFVIDFAFVKEKVAIEIDGESHNTKKQRTIDKKRDRFFYNNGWVVIRIPDKKFFSAGSGTFFRALIKEVVEERRKQYEGGQLKFIDIPEYKDEDY